jgi:hypothetical protein
MPQRNDEDKKIAVQAAKEYVRQQIETMKAHGARPELSSDAFNEIVEQVAQATR